jgi:hypothetical protein
VSRRPDVNHATVDCPDCAAPMPVRTAVMVAGRDGLFRVHGVCPLHGSRVVGPLASREIATLRAARVLQATEVPALALPIEHVPAAAESPLTWDDVLDFAAHLDLCPAPAALAETWEQQR